MIARLPLFQPDWCAPENVVAFTTTTVGGISEGDCATLNLGTHVNDNPQHVAENRLRLQQQVGEAVELCWLNQTHSDIIIDADNYDSVVEGDAATARHNNRACVVMTADCLPVLLCNASGTRVAALHCGWKGLHQNLINKTIRTHFDDDDDAVIAWLGPAIGQDSYEVDDGLFQRFVGLDAAHVEAFIANRDGHYLMNLYTIARRQLQNSGVSSAHIFGGDFDTFTDSRCFSHRRSPKSGRMASVIYLR